MNDAQRGIVKMVTEEEAFSIAEELIDQHGDAVAAFVNAKATAAVEAVDLEQIGRWHAIRNAVAITLGDRATRH